MSVFLSLMLAHAPIPVLPEIDRRTLELQARAEALRTPAQTRRTTTTTATSAPKTRAATSQRTARPAATPQHTTRQAAATQRPATLRRASGGALDLSAITTICRAAGNQADPAAFLATLARSYSLSSKESTALRTNCAAYLAGRADARIRER